MSIANTFADELQHESVATRKLLEIVPEAHFGWRPHEKSMTLVQLASHLAEIPTWAGKALDTDEYILDMKSYKPFIATTRKEILERFDANLKSALEKLRGVPDAKMSTVWKLKKANEVVLALPRAAVVRGMVLNHSYHHRGQLSVYLRLKDVPLPSIYGPSADTPR